MDKYRLVKYIRDKKGYIGCLVAVKQNNTVSVGWSKYARNKENKSFNKKFGRELAFRRALLPHERMNGKTKMPFVVQDEIDSFIERAEKYFRTERVFISFFDRPSGIYNNCNNFTNATKEYENTEYRKWEDYKNTKWQGAF